MATVDAASALVVHALDMGTTKYGDCILCRLGDRSILIDGGHPGDTRDRGEYKSIPHQLEQIFGHAAPFDISLLVVTHCHSDHIGCLPAMVKSGTIRPKWALVADEHLGFGIPFDGDSPLDAPTLPRESRRLVAALREEDHSDLSDAELRDFLADAATLEENYFAMLASLDTSIAAGRLVRYGRDDPAALVAEFADFGLEILGPTEEHLLICAEEVRRSLGDLIADVGDALVEKQFGDAATFNELNAYRALARENEADVPDGGRPGYALNNQSIILKLEVGTAKVLLTGDMQFAASAISELDPLMDDLRAEIKAAAPFDLVKIAHHASHNAFDERVLEDMKTTKRYVISGGIRDRGHPDAGVLQLLRRARSSDGIEWARTDKNGRITATFGAAAALKVSRGRKNSTRPNVFDVQATPLTGTSVTPLVVPPPAVAVVPSSSSGPSIEQSPEHLRSDKVRIIAEVPHQHTQVTVTINVQPGKSSSDDESSKREVIKPPIDSPVVNLAGGRRLPPLLFITDKAALARNVGGAVAEAVIQAIRGAGHSLIDALPAGVADAVQAMASVRPQLQAARGSIRGVVIVGGYDVVPSMRLDTIDAPLRNALDTAPPADGFSGDMDNFIVWSDALYADVDGDGIGDLPVSRVPDGQSAEFLIKALQAGASSPNRRAGIRNYARPFAARVFEHIPYNEHPSILVSADTAPNSAEFQNGHFRDAAIYLMLHGHYQDTRSFSGERSDRRAYTAINVDNIAAHNLEKAVVFAGCCWGALTVRERAVDVHPGGKVTPLKPSDSMALSCLKAGAAAFIGCTGVHYSPAGDQPSHNGGPLHVGFWKYFAQGLPPAEALYRAKTDYITGIPHDPQGDAFDRAVELKILREFTCLGLGW